MKRQRSNLSRHVYWSLTRLKKVRTLKVTDAQISSIRTRVRFHGATPKTLQRKRSYLNMSLSTIANSKSFTILLENCSWRLKTSAASVSSFVRLFVQLSCRLLSCTNGSRVQSSSRTTLSMKSCRNLISYQRKFHHRPTCSTGRSVTASTLLLLYAPFLLVSVITLTLFTALPQKRSLVTTRRSKRFHLIPRLK